MTQTTESEARRLPWLKSTEGYTVEVEDAGGKIEWATAIAPARRCKAPASIISKDGSKRADFNRMERTCLIYRKTT